MNRSSTVGSHQRFHFAALLHAVAGLFGTALVLSTMLCPDSNAQTAECPLRGDATINTVANWVRNPRQTEDRTITLIQICHLGFQLDAPALDALSGTKASPAIYEALNKATAALLTVDQAHAQAAALQSALGAAASGRAALYRQRIEYLEHASYVDMVSASFGSYDPKSSRLTATLGGEEYRFDTMPAQTEDTLFKNWPKVQVMRPYADDDLHSRTLAYASIAASGYSRKAKEEQNAAMNKQKIAPMLVEAQARMDRGDYDGAVAKYNEALLTYPDSKEAEDGLKKAEQLKEEQKAKDAAEIALGEWTDHTTGLMWTIHGDDRIVPFKRAQEYCQSLRLGDRSDWRLPNREELLGLFDQAPKNQRIFRFELQTFQYAMRGPIQLTRPFVWSSTLEKQGSKNAWKVNFGSGQAEIHYGIGVPGLEALCVRGAPDTHADEPIGPIQRKVFSLILDECNRGIAESCGNVGSMYADTKSKYVEHNDDKAMEYYHKSCQMGYDTGCSWANDLVNKLNKQAKPK